MSDDCGDALRIPRKVSKLRAVTSFITHPSSKLLTELSLANTGSNMENNTEELNDYAINVTVKGYDGLVMEVNVIAKDHDDAIAQACGVEPRYQDDDPYCLLVLVGEDDSSVFCTYPNLIEATKHVQTLRSGRWMLVQRDMEDEGEGTIIKSWEDVD